MTKPDYKSMTRVELKNYLLKNRQDQEGWDEFLTRLTPNAVTFPPMWEMNPEQIEQFKEFWKKKVGSEPIIEDWMLQKP